MLHADFSSQISHPGHGADCGRCPARPSAGKAWPCPCQRAETRAQASATGAPSELSEYRRSSEKEVLLEGLVDDSAGDAAGGLAGATFNAELDSFDFVRFSSLAITHLLRAHGGCRESAR